MKEKRNIIIKPDKKMFLIQNLYTFLLLLITLILTGYEGDLVRGLALVAMLFVILFLIKEYWYWATYTWEISETQIKTVRGVFNRSVDYIELYRIVDFYENQNILQQLFGIKDVYIISNDRTHPVTKIFGVPYSLNLIKILNPLVKKSRKENHIYEIANR